MKTLLTPTLIAAALPAHAANADPVHYADKACCACHAPQQDHNDLFSAWRD